MCLYEINMRAKGLRQLINALESLFPARFVPHRPPTFEVKAGLSVGHFSGNYRVVDLPEF